MISWWCDRSVRLVSQPVSCDGERARDQSHMWPRSSCGHLWNLVSDSPELSLCMSKRQESHLNWTDANVTSLLGDNWSSSNGTGGDKKYSKPGSQDFIVAQPISSGMQEMHLSCLLRRWSRGLAAWVQIRVVEDSWIIYVTSPCLGFLIFKWDWK